MNTIILFNEYSSENKIYAPNKKITDSSKIEYLQK